jgi:anti-sigma factor RsiW
MADISDLLAVIDRLSPEELAQIRERIDQRTRAQRTAAAWEQAAEAAAAHFRGDSSPEELDEIFEVIKIKSQPSEKTS